jgi:hypothetical protein
LALTWNEIIMAYLKVFLSIFILRTIKSMKVCLRFETEIFWIRSRGGTTKFSWSDLSSSGTELDTRYRISSNSHSLAAVEAGGRVYNHYF